MGPYSTIFHRHIRFSLLLVLLVVSCLLFFATLSSSRAGVFPAFAQSQSRQPWLVRSYIWNTNLNLWARTSCSMSLGGAGASAPTRSVCDTTSSDARLSYLQYHHDTDPDDTTPKDVTDDVYGKIRGRAWSPVYGVIYFDPSDFPSSGNVASCYGLTGDARQARIRKTGATVELIGCAYVPLLRQYVLFNKVGATDASVPSSGWDGVLVTVVESTTDAYLTLNGCAWSSGNGFWAFGPNQSTLSTQENCLPSGHNTKLSGVLSESTLGSAGRYMPPSLNVTDSEAHVGQEIGYQYRCPQGYASPALSFTSNSVLQRIISTDLSLFSGVYREVFLAPLEEIDFSCTDIAGIFSLPRSYSGALGASVQDAFFVSSFTAHPSVLTEGGFISFRGAVSNQDGFADQVVTESPIVGHCDNRTKNTCFVGTANDTAVADDTTYYKWQCDESEGTNSGPCQVPKSPASVLQTKLVASDKAKNDQFAYSVAISGNTAVVGAPGVDYTHTNNTTYANQGAVYVFTKSGNTWTKQATLRPVSGAYRQSYQ